jgi:uncharacterized protein Usg
MRKIKNTSRRICTWEKNIVCKSIILVKVLYYIPDYTHLLQEFFFQTEDIVPDIPRVHYFLNYWKENIDAIIKEVSISSSYHTQYNNSQFYKVIN